MKGRTLVIGVWACAGWACTPPSDVGREGQVAGDEAEVASREEGELPGPEAEVASRDGGELQGREAEVASRDGVELPGPKAQVASREAELASLERAAAAYHEAASAKDREGVVASYDEDALMVPPGAELVEGLEAVRGYRFGFIETPGIALRFETLRAEVSASGDMGWTLALGDITIPRSDGPPDHDTVRDFHVWKKGADGAWRVVADVWNSGAPPGG